MAGSGFRDYFKVLEIERNANKDEIKRSFRKLARKYHPDVNPGDAKAEEKFKEVNEAYEVLSDPEKRRKYEQFGKYWNQSSGMGGAGPSRAGIDIDFGNYANFDDFINELLGKFATNQRVGGVSGGSSFARSVNSDSINLDAQVELRVSLLEAFNGTERTLSVNKERVHVIIPRGVKSGSRLRLKGKGNIQPGTGKRGDLYLNIDIKSHPIWKIQGDQLQAELPISLDEFVLGSNVDVMTLDGEAKVTIPSGTVPGQNLRLKGKGWPIGNRRGDLIFTLVIQFPKKWTEEEMFLFEELKKIRSNNPRDNWIKSASS